MKRPFLLATAFACFVLVSLFVVTADREQPLVISEHANTDWVDVPVGD